MRPKERESSSISSLGFLVLKSDCFLTYEVRPVDHHEGFRKKKASCKIMIYVNHVLCDVQISYWLAAIAFGNS